jgi:hypothetical protein
MPEIFRRQFFFGSAVLLFFLSLPTGLTAALPQEDADPVRSPMSGGIFLPEYRQRGLLDGEVMDRS